MSTTKGWTLKFDANAGGWLAWTWEAGRSGKGGNARLTGEPVDLVRLVRALSIRDGRHGRIVDMCDPKATLALALDTLARGGAEDVTVER